MRTRRLPWILRASGLLAALAAPACAQFMAAPGSPFPAGTAPFCLAVGDFNGDGKLDFAIVNETGNTVTVLLGNGAGGFTAAPGSPFPTGTIPDSIAVGDFNADGKLDLAIANAGSNDVTVLLGDGAGGFTAAPGSPFPVGSTPDSIAAWDFNADGKLDLAIANAGSNSVTLLLGDGAGGFTAAPGSPFTVGSGPVSLAVGDFNGDGAPDLAVATLGDNGVTVLLGNGTGGFAAAPGSPFTVGTYPLSVAVGDFNRDGKPDLAIANYGDGTVTLMLGDGTGAFTAAPGSPFSTGPTPDAVAVGDLNGDGKPDLAITNYSYGTVTILLGDGTGGFAAPGTLFVVGAGPTFVALADLNGDRETDLAIANSASGTVTVLLSNGTGGFTAAPGSPLPAGSGPVSVAVGDFNGDGKPDLAIANARGNNITVLLGNGAGGFTAAPGSPFAAGSTPHSVAVGDFNGDGTPDLAIADYGGNNVTVLLGNGAGGFSAAPGSPVAVGTAPDFLAVGDFNGDGKPDLAIANYGSNNVTVLLGNGAGRFTAAPGSPFAAGIGPTSLAVGDFNGDARLDLAIASAGSQNLTVLLGNGAGGFAAAPGSPVTLGATAVSVAVGDFNGDGRPDLAVGCYEGALALLLGDGTGAFTPAPGSPFGLGGPLNSLAVADFNGDGRPDLAVANHGAIVTGGSDTVWVLLGNGRAGFAQAAGNPFGVGMVPTSVAAADFNGDGKTDLAVANGGDGTVTVLLNGSAPPPPALLSPANGAAGIPLAPALMWGASRRAASYDVYFGTTSPPPLVTSTAGTSYAPGTLGTGAQYFWRVVAKDSLGSSASAAWSFTTQVPPPAAALTAPANGASGVVFTPALLWGGSSGASSYDVYFGTSSAPPLVTSTAATRYSPGTLTPYTTYYWQIVARNTAGAASSATWVFTTGANAGSLRFVPVIPCRVADTRGGADPFGGPSMTAGSSRSFAIPQSACAIPGTALAYSLNVTVVPAEPLRFLTLWPTGQAQANVSTLNSWGGNVVANAALVPAGTDGAVSVYVPDATDVILDINGYFDTSSGPNSYTFYPATPCRIADTRNPADQFGGPSLSGGQSRDFAIPLSPCGLPATARAYSLNVTAVPDSSYLGFLTAWPAGEAQPVASTLNSWTGTVAANAAIVPAGSGGSISVFVSDQTDLILDSNGYFAAPGSPGALTFYPVTPCRVADTRWPEGPFGGPEMGAGETRWFTIPAGGCAVPATAAAYSLNVTVVPDARLSFLSAWAEGAAQPNVSTLNSWDGSVVANAAIVPAGTDGAIGVFVTDPTQVILDINGYFAP